ncbi:MAG: glycosyltransferase [Chloroflexi bacterium]|nr:MAG: glycosyltransferase [Chloroflexota bacterium]
MAVTKAVIQAVDVGSAPIDRYRDLLGAEAWNAFELGMRDFADRMRGRTLWNVNSTPRGGGVAELLAALIPYDRGAGVDERWLVIEGSPEFFAITKKIHTLLHGVAPDGSEITPVERGEYEQAMARNSAALLDQVRPGDVVLLHDPQTAGLVSPLSSRGITVIWRSHVGVDRPNAMVRNAWKFLTPYMNGASAFVFSRRAYVWDDPDGSRIHIIAPCIDPFTTKNRDLDVSETARILAAAGVLRGIDGEATFLRHDGRRGRVTHTAAIGSTPPSDARLVVQVSRWDRLKDPIGVTEAFVRHIAPRTDAWLVLAGPAVDSVDDDPEQPEILAQLQAIRDRLPRGMRERIVVAELPMQDIEENAAIVNALQRRADVVVQKSLAEGFGLTVAEAMWKGRPVVASRVGGIEDQIEDGESGVLIDDPTDLDAFGSAVVDLLHDPQRAAAFGREARLRVIREFLAPRHLMQQAQLVISVI